MCVCMCVYVCCRYAQHYSRFTRLPQIITSSVVLLALLTPLAAFKPAGFKPPPVSSFCCCCCCAPLPFFLHAVSKPKPKVNQTHRSDIDIFCVVLYIQRYGYVGGTRVRVLPHSPCFLPMYTVSLPLSCLAVRFALSCWTCVR